MKDVLGEAISDYFYKRSAAKLWVNNKYGPREEMPTDTYFRDPDDMPELEWVAVQQCRGRILDIGAGAGSHSLILQQMGLDITAVSFQAVLCNDWGQSICIFKGWMEEKCGSSLQFRKQNTTDALCRGNHEP